jgi:hypothetical protein
MTNVLQVAEETDAFAHLNKFLQDSADRMSIVSKLSSNETRIVTNALEDIANDPKLVQDISNYQLASNIPEFPDFRFILRCISYTLFTGDSDFTDEHNLLDDRKLKFLKERYIASEISTNFTVRVVKTMKTLAISLIDDASSNEVSVYFDRVINSFEQKVKPLWERLVEIGRQVPDEEWAKLPTDLSWNFEHYMYGATKQD